MVKLMWGPMSSRSSIPRDLPVIQGHGQVKGAILLLPRRTTHTLQLASSKSLQREYSWCWHRATEHQLYSWSCWKLTASVYCLLGAKTRKVQLSSSGLPDCHSLLCPTAHLKWTEKEVPSTTVPNRSMFLIYLRRWMIDWLCVKGGDDDDDVLKECCS